MSKKALIIVDIQNEYFENGGLELVNPVEASLNAGKILEHFRTRHLPVIHVQHLAAEKDSPVFAEGSFGVQIHENVQPLEGEKVIQKYYPNSFRETDLSEHLKTHKITELVIVGMMTHMCIDATTRAAFDFGYHCTVASDACATRDLEINGKTVAADDVHHAFLAALAFAYGNITSTEELLKTDNV